MNAALLKLRFPPALLTLLIFVSSCASPVSTPVTPLPTTVELIEPGDSVNGMSFRTAESRRDWGITLWSFCDLTFEPFASQQIEYVCGIPPLRWVFLGYGTSARTAEEVDAVWKTRAWEMEFDGQPVNLPAFGTIDDSYAGFKFRYWNVVLVAPQPGFHTLRYVVYESGCNCEANEQILLTDIVWKVTVGN
jgi:hypothetical protein